MNEQLSTHSWGWWLEMPSHPLWRQSNVSFWLQVMHWLYVCFVGNKQCDIRPAQYRVPQHLRWLFMEFSLVTIDTLRLRQNGHHFADDIYKCTFLNENVWISLTISLKFVPKFLITNIPALVQIMAWRHPGNKPLSGPMMVSSSMHICVTLPQWVNMKWTWGLE